MNPALETVETGAAPPRRVPRFLSCLVKGPLGCLFFALGAAAVLVLLLPPALGRVLDRALERWFSERYAGHLELGDAWLGSFYDTQRIERVILRDPSGDEILRGELKAPPLTEFLEDPSRRFGPIVLRIDLLHLVEDEDGTTNLERALEELEPDRADSEREGGLSTDMPFRFELDVKIARLRSTNARGRATELTNLEFDGSFEWGKEETRLVLEGGSDSDDDEPMHLRVELSRPEFGRLRRWKCALSLERSPTALARTLCAPARPLAILAGPRTDRLNWSKDGPDVALLLEDEGARFELLGEELDGLVTSTGEGALTATLPCSCAPGQALLARLLPLVVALECVDPAGSHELRLADYRWPLDGDWSRLSGELALALAPASCEFVTHLRPSLGERTLLQATPLRMQVRDGVLAFAGLAYALLPGELRVDGTLALESGDAAITVAGALGGEPVDLRLTGVGDDLVPALPAPPAPLEGDVAGVPVPPRQDR